MSRLRGAQENVQAHRVDDGLDSIPMHGREAAA
jgi:hypothetical protein